MDRIKDYAGFTLWFVGLGYVALWPLTASELDGRSFGASVFCHDAVPAFLDFVCNTTHPLSMAPGLHALGLTATVFVTLRLLCSAIKRSRRVSRAASASLSATAPVDEPPRQPRVSRSTVKPRTEFGLRGVRR